ncbi:MAG TPA: hypothetical protein GX499_10080 [Clostridiales bacterium]|jgi:K+-sensing histidine kinase KdpD|nr:hypothetical protein [Clostridiales bacterium]
MAKTVVFVTNQYSCDRIIYAARIVAEETKTELNIIEILDSEYELNPQAIDYLYNLAKAVGATMRIVFTGDKLAVMREEIAQYDCSAVVTGMPSSHNSVLYDLWKEFPNKQFHTVDVSGELVDVACNRYATA